MVNAMAMNFVDVQPQSFLDYAWTSPTPAPPPAPKPSKTSRKQNRCCDQCRKGKRACDAAILEDTLLDPGGASGGPALFHYSDSFGCLAPCGNCEKTRKACTFQWLREQRIAQATPPHGQTSAPPAKKRRTQSGSSQKQRGSARIPRPRQVSPTNGCATASRPMPHEFMEPGLFLAEFPGMTQMFNADLSLSPSPYFDAPISGMDSIDQFGRPAGSAGVLLPGDMDEYLDPCSNGSDMHDVSDDRSLAALSSQTSSSKGSDAMVRVPRKRRRRSLSREPNGEPPCPILCLAASGLASSANNALLTEGLLRIYHDSFENHLSCWLTERTCPYVQGSGVSLPGDAGPDWNRMYYRVFKLDHSSSIRGRGLSARENKVASKAINLAILSYATQWAHSNRNSNAKYPFHSDEIDGRNGTSQSDPPCGSFDRALRVSTWHQARNALKDAAEIESFRVVLALLVFSLTQKPFEEEQGQEQTKSQSVTGEPSPIAKEDVKSASSVASLGSSDEEMDECADLLSKLDLAIDNGQPPVHLEQGLRLVHSLRCRMTMTGAFGGRIKKTPLSWKRSRILTTRLEPDDKATVDLLFWLGIMFDTLTSAMHKRPLVVSLEDSDLPATRSLPEDAVSEIPSAPAEDLWDAHLYPRQRKLPQRRPTRWPCSYAAATSVLCDAAPVKVLLFRKVTRIQTLMARRVRGDRMEKAIQGALELCAHWQKLYAPFIRDCIDNHEQLPARVQSWYICLSSHWHLATLLLADLIEMVDDAELSDELQRHARHASHLVSSFKELNCRSLSDIAWCACPPKDVSPCELQGLHFAMNRQAILTEPWVVVLIRAFATAGVLLLEFASGTEESGLTTGEALMRADHCVRALRYLGQRSDAAFAAWTIIGAALEKKREKLDEGGKEGVAVEGRGW